MATFDNQQFQQPWDYSLKDYLDNEVVIEKEPPDMQQSWAAAAPIPSESHHLRNPTIMQMHRIAPAPSHLHMQMFVQNCVQNHVANLDHIKQEPGTSFVGYGQQPLPVPAQSPGTPVAAATPDAAAYVPRMSVVSDDKNDDSGVSMKSPGDLTNSGRSTPNSVPRSADSPLQLSPPPSSREPTPDSIRSESNGKKKSPDDEAADPPAAKQRRKSTSTPKTPRFSSGGGPRPDPHKCPRCEDPPFSTQSKLEFAEHLTEHVCREDKDYDRIFRYVVYQLTQKGTAGTPEELEVAQVQKLICDREQQEMKRINQERIANGEDPLKEKSIEPGTYVPRITNQGNVKLTKCKHCDKKFLAKVEYWFHLKEEHMQKMKIMNCPNCDFITQFKHHLEYHLRNHAGSKPFKCDDCDYNCVNKSMLNSHKKSHSNIYQFRCLDCGYATKYLHSLKLHLRKYNHRPDQVLNSDGLPSPNAIVDVHGTRRGPKAKPRKDEIQELGGECSQSSNTSNASPTNMQNIVSTPMQPFAFNPIMPTGAPAFTPNFVPTSAPAITNGQPLMVNGIPAQFNPSFPTLPISNSQLSYLSQFPHLLNMVQNPFSIVTNDMLQRVIQHHQWTQLINNQQQQQQQSPDNLSTNDDSAENQPRLSVSPSFVKLEPVEEVAEEQPEPVNMTTAQIPEEPLNMSTEAPLDLSKPDPTALELSIKVEAPKIFKSTNRRRKGTAPIRVEMKTERDSDLDTSNEYEMPSSTLSPPLTSGEDSTQAPSPMQESFVPKRRHSYNV